MAGKAFEKIMAGMQDALAFAEGDATRGIEHKIELHEVDVVALRKRLGLSQARFAATFGFSPKTVRNWEQGLRHPEGPARILLQVIEREPEAVIAGLAPVTGQTVPGIPLWAAAMTVLFLERICKMAKNSNTAAKALGLALVVIGIGLAVWGHQISGSLASQLSNKLTGAMPNEVMYRYIGGAVSAVVGVFLLLK